MSNCKKIQTESQSTAVDSRRWLTVLEASIYLKCSMAKLNKDRQTGLLKIPFSRFGRSVRYDRAALDAYLEQGAQ